MLQKFWRMLQECCILPYYIGRNPKLFRIFVPYKQINQSKYEEEAFNPCALAAHGMAARDGSDPRPGAV
jgi:hypothetical protein